MGCKKSLFGMPLTSRDDSYREGDRGTDRRWRNLFSARNPPRVFSLICRVGWSAIKLNVVSQTMPARFSFQNFARVRSEHPSVSLAPIPESPSSMKGAFKYQGLESRIFRFSSTHANFKLHSKNSTPPPSPARRRTTLSLRIAALALKVALYRKRREDNMD